MTQIALFFANVCFLVLLGKVHLLNNGVARTPPMGWMSWGYYMCGDKCEEYPERCLDEKLILSVADEFYNNGYVEAGFEYIIIDDCWSEMQRDEYDNLVPSKKRFPRGIKFISDYIHERGLKFGMYTNIADLTCMHYPGSKGHFAEDAKQFARWGVDYLKVDGCFVEENYLNKAYIELGHYLRRAGRNMVYSCSWPYYIEFIHHKKSNYTAISSHCNLWRNYHDVQLSWDMVKNIIKHYEYGYDNLAIHHGPGHWNDPDMLIFGTGTLTDSQSRVQLVVYSMLSAPLLLSCDMSKITAKEKQLLVNLDLLAVGQDALGIMAKPYSIKKTLTLWVKPHLPMKGDQYHSMSFALVNLDKNETQKVFVTPEDYGLNSTDGYTVMDVLIRECIRNVTLKDDLVISAPPEDVVMYTLYPL